MSNGKNLAKVKDMVEGKFGGYKPQVGFGEQEGTPIRKVGEEWEDSEGYKWTQREGYAVKSGTSPNVGIFHQQCEDCDKNGSQIEHTIRTISNEYPKGPVKHNIKVLNKKNSECARGLSSFSSDEILRIMGHHSKEIEKILGYVSKSEVIHKDDMVRI